MTTTATTYREACHHLLAQARAELEAGHLRQAAEKGWGAAAQIVKALAVARGWSHEHHRDLFIAVRELSNDMGDPEVHRLFLSANGLHHNFYENTFDAPMLTDHLARTERFVAKLDPLLDE